jgi:hypothetical protein
LFQDKKVSGVWGKAPCKWNHLLGMQTDTHKIKLNFIREDDNPVIVKYNFK